MNLNIFVSIPAIHGRTGFSDGYADTSDAENDDGIYGGKGLF
jgi:hypothetical protein